MFQVYSNNPRILHWQGRLARMPRWAWIAFIVGAVVPMVALLVFLFFAAIVTGLIVMAGVMVVAGMLGVVSRLLHRRRGVLGLPDDGRRNVKIAVHSARVIDP